MPSSTRASPTPSPPPSAPILSTPGARATALQKVFTATLTATLKSNSYGNFSACFPTPAAHCAPALEGVWRQLNAKLEEGCLREYEEIIKERRVVEGLNAWDGRIEEARWRLNRSVGEGEGERGLHMLSAEELWRGYLGVGLGEATEVLEQRLRESQEGNLRVMDQIARQREEIERLVKGLEGMVRDVEGAVEGLGEGDIEELRREAWEMEMEVKGTM